jgi:hypothetical protein
MKQLINIILSASIFLLLTVLPGCQSSHTKGFAQYIQERHDLFTGYWNGDVTHARTSLEHAIDLTERSTELNPAGRAAILSLDNSTSHLINTSAG